MRGAMGKSILSVAAMSLMMGQAAAPAIRPEPEHKRVLVKVPSRADKKKAKRRAEHRSRIEANSGRWGRENKLRRRLRRKFELGRAGAF